MYCPKCGAPNNENVRFCKNCGCLINQNQIPNIPNQNQFPNQFPNQNPKQMTDQFRKKSKANVRTSIIVGTLGIICYLLFGISNYAAAMLALTGYIFASRTSYEDKNIVIVAKLINSVLLAMAIISAILYIILLITQR